MNEIRRGRGFYRSTRSPRRRLGQEVFDTCRWNYREKGCDVSVVVVGSTRLTALERVIMTRIVPCVIAALALCLSACTNPYDPVQRGLGGGILGAASGAAIGAAAGGGPGAALGAAIGGATGILGSREHASTPTGHLFRIPSLRTSCLRISGLCTAGLWVPRQLRVPRLCRSSGIWIPRLPGIFRLLRSSELWKSRLLGIPRRPRSPGVWIAEQLGIPRLLWNPGLWIPEPTAIPSVFG